MLDIRDEHKIIGRILAKYPELTPEEESIMNEWLKKEGNKNFLEELVPIRDRGLQRMMELKEYAGAARQKWYALVPARPAEAKVRRINWPAYAAAASIVLVLSAALWFWGKEGSRDTDIVPSAAIAHDAAPGKFKASLTLSDGTVVILDSAGNQLLAKQGGVNVLNKDGKVVYEGGNGRGEVVYNTLATAKGETYATVLSDGTKVWLNAQSSLRFPVVFAGGKRNVEIKGEGYFEVHHDKAPFTVSAGDMNIEVLGTHFNVNSYADEATANTTLVEGKVKVSTEGKEIVLQPGQQAQVAGSGELNKITNADVDAAVAWHLGYFEFNNADLPTVMRQLARWYDMEVVYDGTVPKRQVVGNIPRDMNLSQVLDILKKIKVQFTIEGKKIIVHQ